MSIILSRSGMAPVRLNRTTIADESYLQQYIYDHPETLPFDELDEDARPLVLCREFPTESGPIDALATDASANVYLIETKLYKNPDKRRVLAQVLDYGAAIWKEFEDPDDFVTRLDAVITGHGGKALSARVAEFYSLAGEALSTFLDNFKKTIANGEFRFVVLLDHVDDRLKNLIAYMNTNSNFDLFGVGLDFYEHEDTRILIPALHGAEAKKAAPRSRSDRKTWDEDSFFMDAAGRVNPTAFGAMKTLHAWATQNGSDMSYGTGKRGSFTPKFAAFEFRGPISVYSDGIMQLKLNLSWYKEMTNGASFHSALVNSLVASGLIAPGPHESDLYLKIENWQGKTAPLTAAMQELLATATGSAGTTARV
jgi:hypothetical protein